MGVVARPGGVSAGASRRRQMCDDIAVRVENADFRDVASGHVLLPARLSQQCLRRENRHLIVPLARQDRWPIIASIMLGSHCGAPFGSADVFRTLRPRRGKWLRLPPSLRDRRQPNGAPATFPSIVGKGSLRLQRAPSRDQAQVRSPADNLLTKPNERRRSAAPVGVTLVTA
jgi:hypothetical protein